MKSPCLALTAILALASRCGRRSRPVTAKCDRAAARSGDLTGISCAEQRLLSWPRRERQLDEFRSPACLCDRNFERLHGWGAVGFRQRSGAHQYSHGRQFAFAPSFQGGYFQRFGVSDWLWGAKLSYNYLGATSTNTNSIIPQFGTYTTIANPTPVPFSGPAYVRAAQTSLLQEIDLIPFLGHAFGPSYVYAGGGPTLSQTRTRLNGLVGFALVDGGIVDQSGAPQDFSSSSWLVGGAAVVGVTYFLTPTWFVDLNYSYALTEGHTANFASPFVDQSSTSVGTLVGNSAWRAETQRVGLTINKAF